MNTQIVHKALATRPQRLRYVRAQRSAIKPEWASLAPLLNYFGIKGLFANYDICVPITNMEIYSSHVFEN